MHAPCIVLPVCRSNHELDHTKGVSRVAARYFPRNLPFRHYYERYRIALLSGESYVGRVNVRE